MKYFIFLSISRGDFQSLYVVATLAVAEKQEQALQLQNTDVASRIPTNFDDWKSPLRMKAIRNRHYDYWIASLHFT